MEELAESLSKTISRIEEYTRQPEFRDATLEQVKVRADKLEKYYERFIEAHQKQVECAPKKANKYDEMAAQVETFYFAAHSALIAKVNALKPAPPSAIQQPLAVQVNWPYQQHDLKNTWGEFDGTITKWPGFRDRFIAAIHSNDNVSPAFKFSYLKKSLVGKAARTLGEWQLTDDNYIEAWDRLKQLYDRKYPICREHLRQLFRLPAVEGSPRSNDLQRMSNVTHEALRQLRAQEIPVEGWDMIIVPILHERLDAETSKQWELQRQSETPTIKQLLDFLDRQASALANVADVRRSRIHIRHEATGTSRGLEGNGERARRDQGSYSTAVKKAIACAACGRDHAIWTCGEFMGLTLRGREDLVNKNNLCRNCLKRGHMAGSCFQGVCPRCSGQVKHNSLLCPKKEITKHALIVKNVDAPCTRKDKRCSTKRQRDVAVSRVYSAQVNHSEDFSDIDNEIKRVDRQLSLLHKQDQLLKKRKVVFEQEKDCNTSNIKEREINANQQYGGSFNFGLDLMPALLPTVMIRLEADGQCIGPVRALFDCGAQPNLIASSLHNRYKLPGLPATHKMIGIEGQSIDVSRRVVLKVRPWFDSGSYIEEEFWILPSENNWEPVLPNTVGRAHPISTSLSIQFADQEYWKPEKVRVILNVKVFAKVLVAVHPVQSEGTALIETRLGLVVCGTQVPIDGDTGTPTSYINCTISEDLGELVKRFWQLDEIATCSKRTEEEEKVERIFLETYSRDSTGRFTVTIPIKENISDIGCSRDIALQRFWSLEKRLSRDSELKKQYVEFMREYEQLGHMEQVSKPATPGEMVYYIPHLCVIKKFRVVFDASCRTNKGISLNDVQMLGEKLQRNLTEIIMRFRRHKFGVIATHFLEGV
ncbi:uncharacterized protein LOC118734064 [Rhagoletis pomonella]|uniref:uncharacterized protein LOC118734064 n=1 Tax=Rhagoletis pomonella TaxID=28610 RepID=UPI00177E6BED|nr:uncharacterized protein LOC118734064 [Rhagoletis pomonella]